MLNREVYEVNGLDDIPKVDKPVRLAFKGPLYGGPPLGRLREKLAPLGRVRFSGTTTRIFCDLDPGPVESVLIALDMIVRSDAKGLERTILSALGQVDEISVSVDGRSDDETKRVADGYADRVQVFQAADIGLSEEAWTGNRIHFANARNIGRSRLQAPWALVIDSDEYLASSCDLRKLVTGSEAARFEAFEVQVQLTGFVQDDFQRLARSSLHWERETHNMLMLEGRVSDAPDTRIVQDTSLRPDPEIERRTAQRADGMARMEADAAKGDLHALFHVVKWKAPRVPPAELVTMTQDYRLRAEVHGPLSEERGFLAWMTGVAYFNAENFMEAEIWAHRALFDGPRLDALMLLGYIAQENGELVDALFWFECACLITSEPKHGWPEDAKLRFVTRDQLRAAVLAR